MADIDFEKAMSMMSMLGGDKKDMDIMPLLDMFMPKTERKAYNKDNLFEKVYDESDKVKCLRTSVPYLQYNNQKNILLLIKMLEVQKLIEIYNTSDKKKCEKHDMFGLLEDMLSHIDDKNRESLKKCLDLGSLVERINLWVK